MGEGGGRHPFLEQALAVGRTDPQLAYKLLVSVLNHEQGNGEAWYALGCLQAEAGQNAAAVVAFERCLATGPDAGTRVRCLTNIGHRLYHMGEFGRALVWTRRAIELDGNCGYAWANLAAIELQYGKLAESVGAGLRGVECAPEPATEVQLALSLLNARQWMAGLWRFEARFRFTMTEFQRYPYRRWDGGPVERLFVACEQGLGDTLSAARFVPYAAERVGRVVFGVQRGLRRLLSFSLPGVEIVEDVANGPFPEADAWCPVLSLPLALRWKDRDFEEARSPFMPLDEPRLLLDAEGGAPSGGDAYYNICISWAGEAANIRDRWRSVPVEALLPLAAVPGVRLWSFQVGERAADLHRAGGAALVGDMAPALVDAQATAEALAGFHLVITVDSFLAHLAGALGVPCWVLVSERAGDWRLGRAGEKAALWYPEHRVFRQGLEEGWDGVVKRVEGELRRLVDA